MPRIKEYSAQVGVQGPVESRRVSGEDLGAGMFQQVARLGDTVSNVADVVYKKQEQDEIHDIAVQTSKAAAQFKLELNEQLRKGEVNSEEFVKKYDEHMGNLSGNYSTAGGRSYFEKANSQLRDDFIFSATQAQVEIAGVKAISSFNQTAANLQAGVQNDPSSFETLKQSQDDYVDFLVQSGNLDFKTAEKLKAERAKDLSVAAIRGWAEINPHDAKAQVEQGLWDQFLDSDSRKSIHKEISTAIEAKRIDTDRQESLLKKQKEERQNYVMDQFLRKMGDGQLSASEVIKDNTLDFGQKRQVLAMIERDVKSPLEREAGAFNTAFENIHADETSTDKIRTDAQLMKLYTDKKINYTELGRLRKELSGNTTEEGKLKNAQKKQFFNQAKALIVKSNPLTGYKDVAGEERYGEFLAEFQEEYDKKIQAGKSPRELFNPKSPDYMGDMFRRYVRSPQEIMKSNMEMSGFGKKPDGEKKYLPGETPAQYLERTKKKDNK